jgi:serralysin
MEYFMSTYYVSKTGSATGNGSAASPWLTISKAMLKVTAGDTVVVGSGTYNEFVRISAHGTENAYVTVRSAVPGGAKIVAPSTDFGVHIQGDYVKLDGFDISGARLSGITANLTHHVVISNNIAHDNGNHGISATRSDYITIEGNETYGNAKTGPYSGISIFHPENLTGNMTDTGYRIIVRNNVSHDNVTQSGPHSDGNGIIMDDFRSTQDTTRDPYLFQSLVENNTVYSNGGKGIQVDWTDYATVRNNTAWHNNVDPLATGTWKGEISNMNSSNNIWVNNLAVADPSKVPYATAIDNTSYPGYVNSNNTWANNLTYNGISGDPSIKNTGNPPPTVEAGNLLGVNPMLIDPSNDDFRLNSLSAAIDNGTKSYGFATYDFFGNVRAGSIDIGSHEAGDSNPAGHNYLMGGAGSDVFNGYAGNDTLLGMAGGDTLVGGDNNDSLSGGIGTDFLDGGKDNDILAGGSDRDVLVGNAGADVFSFRAVADSGLGALADEIRDFSRSEGDKIDLTVMDASTKAYGDTAFTFIGTASFTKIGGQLRYVDGHVLGDVNGDKIADFDIAITNGHPLVADDFML